MIFLNYNSEYLSVFFETHEIKLTTAGSKSVAVLKWFQHGDAKKQSTLKKSAQSKCNINAKRHSDLDNVSKGPKAG